MHKDHVGSRLGMWLFLYSELLLFGAFFILYSIYSNRYPREFSEAARDLSLTMGSINTLVLLASSLFVALAVVAIKGNAVREVIRYLLATVGCAVVFVVIKGFEWSSKFHHGLYPNSPVMLEKAPGFKMFYSLYFLITGLHAIHVVIGGIMLGVVAWMVHRGRITAERDVVLENSGLYWHLVDLVWIFIFPLFYVVVP